MALRTKTDGSARLDCDCATCHLYLLGPTSEVVLEQASLEGWAFQDATSEGRAMCADCMRGECPGEAVARRRAAGQVPIALVDRPTKIGDPICDGSGRVAGVALNDAEPGGLVSVDVSKGEPNPLAGRVPAHPPPPSNAPADVLGDSPKSASDVETDALFGSIDALFDLNTWNPDD